jgi:hypothetical protein
VTADVDWWQRAACAGLESMFQPNGTSPTGANSYAVAVHVCVTHCPVLAECAEAVNADGPPWLGAQAGYVWTTARYDSVRGLRGRQPNPIPCGPVCLDLNPTVHKGE